MRSRVVVAGVFLVAVAAGCGGSSHGAGPSPTPASTADDGPRLRSFSIPSGAMEKTIAIDDRVGVQEGALTCWAALAGAAHELSRGENLTETQLG